MRGTYLGGRTTWTSSKLPWVLRGRSPPTRIPEPGDGRDAFAQTTGDGTITVPTACLPWPVGGGGGVGRQVGIGFGIGAR